MSDNTAQIPLGQCTLNGGIGRAHDGTWVVDCILSDIASEGEAVAISAWLWHVIQAQITADVIAQQRSSPCH